MNARASQSALVFRLAIASAVFAGSLFPGAAAQRVTAPLLTLERDVQEQGLWTISSKYILFIDKGYIKRYDPAKGIVAVGLAERVDCYGGLTAILTKGVVKVFNDDLKTPIMTFQASTADSILLGQTHIVAYSSKRSYLWGRPLQAGGKSWFKEQKDLFNLGRIDGSAFAAQVDYTDAWNSRTNYLTFDGAGDIDNQGEVFKNFDGPGYYAIGLGFMLRENLDFRDISLIFMDDHLKIGTSVDLTIKSRPKCDETLNNSGDIRLLDVKESTVRFLAKDLCGNYVYTRNLLSKEYKFEKVESLLRPSDVIEMAHLEEPNSLVFRADKSVILINDKGYLKLYDFRAGLHLSELQVQLKKLCAYMWQRSILDYRNGILALSECSQSDDKINLSFFKLY